MEVSFRGEVWHWRGPSPYHFVSVPAEVSEDLRDLAAAVTHGWGMIPVGVRLGTTEWETSLYPKDGVYVVPLKAAVRRAEALDVGDVAELTLTVRGLP